ncbi:GAF domain-containing protein [Streptomyces sp. NPDC087512]|uniref:GAF domain-containing protein n=1 Tax=unclassified Streptomyces TaxID=2593676 RepID=UPI00343FBC89
MRTGAEDGTDRTPGRFVPLLVDACAEAIDAGGGRAGGVYLRSGTPGLLRLAVLAGLPGPLFRPWWRVHADSPFPAADAYRQGVRVILANATEAMRRYPQFAAGLPFPFGSLYVPVTAPDRTYGVLTVLRPAASDAAEMLEGLDRLERAARDLGAALERLERDGGAAPLLWDGEPLCVRPPASRRHPRHAGSFSWNPVTGAVMADGPLTGLLGAPDGADRPPTALGALLRELAPDDGHRVAAALRQAAAGRPPALPLVERPGTDIDEGISALRVALAEAGGAVERPGSRVLADIADRLTVAARQATDRPDDIALLLATRRPGAGSPP